MNFDQSTIALAPRTTSNCLDLSVKFFGHHLSVMLGLWSLIAIPACLIVFLLTTVFELNLLFAVGIAFLASSPLGVLVSLDAVTSAFGERLTVRRLFSQRRSQTFSLLGKGLLQRLLVAVGLMACILPGCWVAVRTGFLVEKSTLRRMDHRLHDAHAEELFREETGELLLRAVWIVLFCAAAWVVLFVSIDVLMQLLFGLPILFGRLTPISANFSPQESLFELFDLLWYDSICLTMITAIILLVYPIGRLAWFFCYIDVRVRRDCWDMELQFAREARRLEGALPR